MSRRLQARVLVVGAGPAGLAAVRRLLAADVSVLWIEQQGQPGGQIWRAALPPAWAADWQAMQRHPLVHYLPGHTVLGRSGDRELLLNDGQGRPLRAAAEQMLLATGARERFLPLPGWTLPGVHGAGGLQALAKGGWPVRGQRIVLAGSGPLLLASADTLRAAGAQVLLIAEQASRAALGRFALGLAPSLQAQALGLRWRLRGTPYRAGCWPVHVLGTSEIEGVRMSDGQREWELPCDALGLGFGLLPNTELAQLLGCRIEQEAIAVDAQQQSSQAGIYAAGECTGYGGAAKALAEGELAACAMLGQDGAQLQRRLRATQRHAALLARHFALRPELFKLADARTLVCRCEDVTLGELQRHPDWREAKLQTRCGMGACQGRICGPICRELLGWQERGLREPLLPAPIACWLDEEPT